MQVPTIVNLRVFTENLISLHAKTVQTYPSRTVISAASCAAPDTPAGAPRHVVVMLMVMLLLVMMVMLIFHVAGAGAGVSAAAAAGVQEGGAQLGHRGPRHWIVDIRY